MLKAGGDRVHVANRPARDAHPPARDLILSVWHVDPLRRPVCQNPYARYRRH